MVKLNNSEKIEDLGDRGLKIIQASDSYKIIQASDSYRFSVDSILLFNFIRVKNYEKIIDLGTGSGIIPLLLFGKKKGLSIYGIEIQKDLADMARRSVELNKLQNDIIIIQEDFRNLKNIFKNPPYISLGQGKINPSNSRAIARHEIKGNLEDIISVSNYLLKNKGRIYLIYRSTKLIKLILTLKKYGIEPKVVKFIHPRQGENANLVLLEGIKGGKEELKIDNPIFQY